MIARKLGVSQVTVSRAIAGSPLVADALRRAILSEAKRCGYLPDATNFEARMMRRRAAGLRPRTNVLCAIVVDEDDPFGFGGRLLQGMNQEAHQNNCDVVMVTRLNGALPRIVLRHQVDGMIRMLGDIELARGVLPSPVPWVSILYDVPGADLVTVNNRSGGQALGRLLATHGHRRVAFIGPDTHLARERLEGLRLGLATGGGEIPARWAFLRRFVCNDAPTRELLGEVFTRLQSDRSVTAIAAYNDFMAELTIRVAGEHGLRVPEDLSVTGFDGVLPSRLHETKPLTTVAMPLEEIGAEAVRLVRWRLEHPNAPRRTVVLESSVIAGETLGPVASERSRSAHPVVGTNK